MEILELTWEMSNCLPGIDASADNPLARATDCLFRSGRPFSRINKCFFLGTDGVVRWLGIFVHSAGDRLLFFPGFVQPQTHVIGYMEKALRWDQAFQIDHLSLESDRKTWHLTTPQSTDHLGKLYTRQLDADRLHWFSMSVANQANLRVVREKTQVAAPTPPRDTDRRIKVFRRARENAKFQLVGLNSEYAVQPEPAFLHFSVVVGSKGFSSPASEYFGGPYGSPFLPDQPPASSNKVPFRVHRVLISENIELEITASALAGSLRTSMLFACPTPNAAARGASN